MALGPECAYRLLDPVGSVRALMTADQDELALVSGIGACAICKIVCAVENAGCVLWEMSQIVQAHDIDFPDAFPLIIIREHQCGALL